MATEVGRLVALLGLDASEYTRGLTRAEAQAKQFAANTRSAIAEVAKILGGLEIGRQVFNATKDIIAEASALNDLSDATGSSVESLSRLNNQAKIAGTDFATLQNAVLKLSQGMAGADEESTKAKEALKILGVTAKDPVEALQQVAVKLNTYADGVNKVGFAVALFGKQGAQFLATLKDIAELQDVGATVSAKQASEAEALEKAFRRLGAEASTFKNAILSDVVPTLLHMIEDMKEGTRIAGGFFEAIRLFGTLNPFDVPGEGIRKLRGEIELLQKAQQKGRPFDLFNELPGEIADRLKKLEFLKLKERQQANALISPSNNDARDFLAQQKPPAPNPPGDKKNARALKEQTDEVQKYLDALLRTQQASMDFNAEETARIFIWEQELKLGHEIEAQGKAAIIDSARQIDQAKEEKASREALAAAKKKFLDDEASSIESAKREVESIKATNESIKEQTILLKDGEAGLAAYTQAKLAKAAAEKEDVAAMLEATGQNTKLIQLTRDAASALKEQATALRDQDAIKKMAADAAVLKDQMSSLFDAASGPLLDFINGTKSAKDAFKDMAKSIERQLSQMALEFLKNQLFGKGGGGGIFDLLGKFNWSSLFGGSSPGQGYGTIGSNIPDGPYPYATGGVSRGGMALVGEHGPELVDLPAGARVTPNNQMRSPSGQVFNINVNVPRGANTQAHRQAALDAWKIASGAARRR